MYLLIGPIQNFVYHKRISITKVVSPINNLFGSQTTG